MFLAPLPIVNIFASVYFYVSDFNKSEQSGACPVLSGVPHGSVLGPCLFLKYIKDMPDSIKGNIRLFANDTIMYFTITNHSDC